MPVVACAARLVVIALTAGACQRASQDIMDAGLAAPAAFEDAAAANPGSPVEAGANDRAPGAGAPAPHRDVSLEAHTMFRCSGPREPGSVKVTTLPTGGRITVRGQGPCPGEASDFRAEIEPHGAADARRVVVYAARGTPSRCLCHGSADFTLRSLQPGVYDVEISGGFDRPIRTRLTVVGAVRSPRID